MIDMMVSDELYKLSYICRKRFKLIFRGEILIKRFLIKQLVGYFDFVINLL